MFANPARSLLGATKHSRLSAPIRSLSSARQPNSPPKNPEQDAKPVAAKDSSQKQAPGPSVSGPPEQGIQPELPVKEWYDRLSALGNETRLPRSVQAIYMRPLRRKAEYGLPVCDLQLRSYSVQNVEFFADFAIRAAYYLNLPVSGPVPLPRIVERWTVPRSNFVHKKSKENFERITIRRLVQIKDGNPEAVQAWLAFLRKHAFYGVGMKANVWEHDNLDAGKSMDKSLPEVEKTLAPHLSLFGHRQDNSAKQSIFDTLQSDRFAERKNI